MSDHDKAPQSEELRFRRGFDLVRFVVLSVGAILGFVLLNRPESVLNHRASNETIARERTRLLLELMQEDDPLSQALGFALIRSSYPDDDQNWITKAQLVLSLKDTYNALIAQRDSLELLKGVVAHATITKSMSLDQDGDGVLTGADVLQVSQQIAELERLLSQNGIPLPATPRDTPARHQQGGKP